MMRRDEDASLTQPLDDSFDERGIPQVGRKRKANKWVVSLVLAVAIVVTLALAARSVLDGIRHRSVERKTPIAERGLPDLTRDAFNSKNVPPPPPGATPKPGAAPAQQAPVDRAAQDLAERRKRAPLLAAGGSGGSRSLGGMPASSATEQAGPGTGSTLGNALGATRAAEVSARQLTDPNLTVTQGSFLDCNLITAINSAQPGMTSCVLSRNIYSTNGRVLLLERGSRIVGQYQSAQLRAGMNRIFVLWTRAETPSGVVVNLDSPGTDALGRSGLDGKIDNHFWERFGSALLVSLVDDLASAAANSQQGDRSGNTVNFTSTAGSANDAAAIIVQNTVNIPPTLDKAQGSHIGIFVARDLYFGSVYALHHMDPQ